MHVIIAGTARSGKTTLALLLNEFGYTVIGTNKDTLRFEINGVTFIKFHASDLIQ